LLVGGDIRDGALLIAAVRTLVDHVGRFFQVLFVVVRILALHQGWTTTTEQWLVLPGSGLRERVLEATLAGRACSLRLGKESCRVLAI
jgi:glutamine amidotransferase-like uncharacterized protein